MKTLLFQFSRTTQGTRLVNSIHLLRHQIRKNASQGPFRASSVTSPGRTTSTTAAYRRARRNLGSIPGDVPRST